MARKKQEIALQREIETQEEWEEVMAMEGLWVVDVYQEWCGPCLALVGNFRRLKNELGDSLLNFAIAKADTIDALEKYRGRCEPTFLFFAGGILTSYIHGANAPKVQRVITEQLASEHKILEGQGERKEVKDPVITRMQEVESERLAEEEARKEAEEPKGVTIAIIKPDAVAQGKAEEILNEMKENGIEVIAEEQRELTDEEARQLYSELQDEPYFEELIRFITSGPSHVLVITSGQTGETVVKDWRELIGPANVEQAKEEAPDSFRAKYGEKGYMNAVHGSSSKNMAAKELAFFFPNLQLPTYLKKKENIQRTLALIRPEAFANKKDEILAKINEAGFKIAMYKELQLTKEQAADFYKEHEQYAYFDSLVETMSSGPVLALGLARDEAIQAWRDALGPANVDEAQEKAPNSLRAKFAGTSGINALHGSDSAEAAKKEISYFFPMEQTIGVIKPDAMSTKDEIIEKIHQAGFRIAAQQETTITPEIVDILYPEQQEAEYYEDLVNSMTSGPTLFMVLSREDAVNGWRREIGSTNPDEARDADPTSLRALFGSDVLNNAVHGSSNAQRAQEEMRAIFGEQPELDETAAVIEKERQEDAADMAPEYRKTEETTTAETTTMDETTVDQETTQNATVDETQQNVTADTTQDITADGDTTQMETTTGDTTQMDTTQGDTTEAEATQRETTIPETSEGETTQAETTAGETTPVDDTANDASAEPTSADPGTTTAVETTVDETAADETAADQTTVDQTTIDETQESKSKPETQETVQETEEATSAEEPAPKDEDTQEAPADKPPSPSQQQQQQPQEQEAAGVADKAEGQEATNTTASSSSPTAATPIQDGKDSPAKDEEIQKKKKDEGPTTEGQTPAAEGGATPAAEGETTEG